MSDFTPKVPKSKSVLAHNIRYLRKQKGISQEELAKLLEIKRSNIAAYESKNVEPRLSIILEIARLFDIQVQALIETKWEESSYPRNAQISGLRESNVINFDNNNEIQEFVEKSTKIRKVLEGFKAFYGFKKENLDESFPNKDKLLFDIDNFLQLMEHLLNYNETVIRAIDGTDQQTEQGQASSSNE